MNKTAPKQKGRWLLAYIEAIRTGEIIVGMELMTELERLETDLQNEKYRYDTTESDLRIYFIEKECKHFKSPFTGKPFILELWEKAFLEALYSFKIWDEELGRWKRRFNSAILLVARKNGKTTFIAAIGLAEFFCGEMGADQMCSSNDYEQAALVFDAMNAMREESPRLDRVTRKNIKGIFMGSQYNRAARGKFSWQNKGSIKKLSSKTQNKEGRNFKFVVVDEVHEMKDNSLVEPLKQSISTQEEPLYIEISTEGNIENGYLDEELAEDRKILAGESENDRSLIWLYTQDSEEEVWQNEDAWQKSNPSIGTVKKRSYLRERLDEARHKPSSRAFVLAKDFNIKQNASVAWLTFDQIANDASFSLEDFSGYPYFGGCDFAETTDLCAAVMIFKRQDDPNTYLHAHFWIPEAKAATKLEDGSTNPLNPEKKDYRAWAAKGLVTIVPGTEVVVSEVADWFFDFYDKYKMVPFRVGYDNRFATEFIHRFEGLCGKDIAEQVSQSAYSLSEPMRGMEADLTGHTLVHNSHPIFCWCLENMSVETDKNGYIKPRKNYGNSKNRIDGGAAALCAYAELQRNRAEFMAMIAILGTANRQKQPKEEET